MTLGKYSPNYDSIKPRIPHAFIRNPNVHIKYSWLSNNPFRNTFEVFKLKQKEENKNIIKDNKLNTRISKIKINENISSYNNSQIRFSRPHNGSFWGALAISDSAAVP